LGVSFDEVAVVAREAQEALNFCCVARWLPGFHFLDFGLFHADLFAAYADSKVIDFALLELAFVDVEVQVVLS
jgi:hypothetical protein